MNNKTQKASMKLLQESIKKCYERDKEKESHPQLLFKFADIIDCYRIRGTLMPVTEKDNHCNCLLHKRQMKDICSDKCSFQDWYYHNEKDEKIWIKACYEHEKEKIHPMPKFMDFFKDKKGNRA